VRFQIYPPEKTAFGADLALSPDGRRIAFSATAPDGRSQLWIRNLDALESRPLPGTEGVNNAVFWSPDSRFLAFAEGARLKKIDISGGPPVTLCDLPYVAGLGSWSPSGVLLVGGQGPSPLWRVSASGGPATAVTRLDPAQQTGRHSFVSFLPDGRHFVYLQQSSPGAENGGIYLGSLDSKPEDQPAKRLLATSLGAQYAPSSDPRTGYILFLRESTLSAQKFDAERLELVGEPVPVAEQVGNQNGVKGLFTVSANSILAFRGVARTGAQLTWFDRQGKAVGTVGDIDMMERPSISPDGRTVAIDRRDLQAGRYDIWLHDLVRSTASRLTSNSTNNRFPIWSPDGSRVAYYTPDLLGGLHQKVASGVGQDDVLSQTLPRGRPMDWSRDGRYIIKGVSDPVTKLDIWVFPLFGDRKPFPYLHSEFNESNARLSPNGQWLAYASDETKRNEVYVQTFPNPTGKWQVSTTGGDLPVWSRDGKELFFLAGGKMMAAEVKSGSKFEAGVPKALFEVHLETGTPVSFDVSKEGRFLIPTRSEQAATAPITVVLNWTAGLKRPLKGD
jgi:Tol biopolymer transport system component